MTTNRAPITGPQVNGAGREREFSYVRSKKQQRIVSIASTPRPVSLDLGAAGLIIVDMQNDFLHPDGWFAARGSTLQDANFRGYDSVLIEDACATISPDFVRDAALYLVRLLHGVVATSDAIFAAIGMPDPAPLSRTETLERS